jgi:hypothetical protein
MYQDKGLSETRRGRSILEGGIDSDKRNIFEKGLARTGGDGQGHGQGKGWSALHGRTTSSFSLEQQGECKCLNPSTYYSVTNTDKVLCTLYIFERDMYMNLYSFSTWIHLPRIPRMKGGGLRSGWARTRD